MAARGDSSRWTDLLGNILDHHNNQIVKGTSFKRKDINDENFFQFLDEKLGRSDSSMAFNTRSVDARSIGDPAWRKRIFKFAKGDRVLVTFDADPNTPKRKRQIGRASCRERV
jgi:hypothetical protein